MGCDIHYGIEVKRDGEWQLHWADTCAEYYKEEGEEDYESPKMWGDRFHVLPKDYDERSKSPFNLDRNYSVFSILGDVRNGSGFAGCDTGDGYVPMTRNRGLPKDATPQMAAWLEGFGCDAHSTSYVTLAEMLAYDFSRTTTKRGWVSLPFYAEWLLERDCVGMPLEMCGGVAGGSVKHIDDAVAKALVSKHEGLLRASYEATAKDKEVWATLCEMEDLDWSDKRVHPTRMESMEACRLASVALRKALGETSYYTQVEFDVPYSACAGQLTDDLIPALQKIDAAPEDIRLVFFFDN